MSQRTTLAFIATALVALGTGLLLGMSLRVRQSETAPASPTVPAFADDFGLASLDSEWWAVETPWHTQHVEQELQWYQLPNVGFPGGGITRLTTNKEEVTGKDPHGATYRYTSAMISTGSRTDRGGTVRREFKYGYFEMRAKLPKGKGIFPAFWLTNDHGSEIDVVEMLGHEPNRVYLTLRRLEDGTRVQQEEYVGSDFSAAYHTFAVDWQPGYVRYYIDGVQRAEFTEDVPSDPLWIVVNTAVGGDWPGEPDSSTVFPQHFDIDYIRVWRTKPVR